MIKVTNDEGRTFNVRVIHKNGRYGRNDQLIHTDDFRALVEFYDATYENDSRFADFMGRGQFVARYYLTTLTDYRAAYEAGQGLSLQGDEPLWTLTGQNVLDAIEYAKTANDGGLRPSSL